MVLNAGDFIQGNKTGDDYEVKNHLATGGFGAVYLITRLSDSCDFVAKEPTSLEKKIIKTLNLEFTVLDNLQNMNVPHVVRVVEMTDYQNDVGHQIPLLIMEVANGKELEKWMANGPIAESDALDITSKICEALTGIHQAGYIHRDIKPENVFVEDLGGRNEVTIIDFGIAAMKSEHDTHVMVSQIAGTPFWSPPEQLDMSGRGAQVSIGNDIFSAGALAIALLLGEPNFSQYRQKAPSPPFDVHNEIPTIDQHFRDIIYKSTWHDRGGRFATMEDMAKALGGGIPDESLPRIVADGRAHTLIGDGPWIIGRKSEIGQIADIPVAETSSTSNYLSREMVEISKRFDGVYSMMKVPSAVNEVMVKKNNRWKEIPTQGTSVGARHVEIALGYTTTPPDEADADGNKLQPGPYKVIEFFPPRGDGTTIMTI